MTDSPKESPHLHNSKMSTSSSQDQGVNVTGSTHDTVRMKRRVSEPTLSMATQTPIPTPSLPCDELTDLESQYENKHQPLGASFILPAPQSTSHLQATITNAVKRLESRTQRPGQILHQLLHPNTSTISPATLTHHHLPLPATTTELKSRLVAVEMTLALLNQLIHESAPLIESQDAEGFDDLERDLDKLLARIHPEPECAIAFLKTRDGAFVSRSDRVREQLNKVE